LFGRLGKTGKDIQLSRIVTCSAVSDYKILLIIVSRSNRYIFSACGGLAFSLLLKQVYRPFSNVKYNW
jgi:hypothetical protein